MSDVIPVHSRSIYSTDRPTDGTGYNVETASCPEVGGVTSLCFISRKEMAFWILAKKLRFVSWRVGKEG
jgi:hypothetical protein